METRTHITQRFAGGEKPFGKTTQPLQNLHNVLSLKQDYNTLAMQVQLQQLKTPLATHSTNNIPFRITSLRNPKNAYIMCFTLGLLPKVNRIRVLSFSDNV